MLSFCDEVKQVSLDAGSGAQGKAVLDLEGLWHPCAISRAAGDAVVPNDLALGSDTTQHGYVSHTGL